MHLLLKTGESVIARQRTSYAHFKFYRNHAVQDRKLTLLWVENFRTTGSSIKRKLLEHFKVLELQKMSRL